MGAVIDTHVMTSARATLASIAEDPDAFAAATASGLSAEHFAVATHRKAFAEIDRWYQDHPSVPAPADILRRADVDEGMAGLYGESSLVVLDDARREREQAEHVRRATLDAQRGDFASARANILAADALATPVEAPAVPEIQWTGSHDFMRRPEPIAWLCEGLQLDDGGRVAALCGQYNGGKTTVAYSIAVSVATGRDIFGAFSCRRSKVGVFDAEQGFRASARKLRRVALGLDLHPEDLDGWIELCSMQRPGYLTEPSARETWLRACEGRGLVVIDSLRAVTSGLDENSSEMRVPIDMLTDVSDRTGCTILVLHHTGKPTRDRTDPGLLTRGSIAIMDAFGCVLHIAAPAEPNEPRKVSQTKVPATAAAGIRPFGVLFEDVDVSGELDGGVRVAYRPLNGKTADANYERDASRLIDAIKRHPGVSQHIVIAKSGVGRTRANTMLNALAEEGRIVAFKGGSGTAHTYRIGSPS